MTDRVEKVSSVVESARLSQASNTASTSLASTLACPKPSFSSDKIGIKTKVAVVAAYIAVLLIALSTLKWAHSVAVVFLAILSIVGFGNWPIQALVDHFRGRKEARLKAQRWHEITRRWEELYYCHRDGIVFRSSDPERSVPPFEIRRLLFQKLP